MSTRTTKIIALHLIDVPGVAPDDMTIKLEENGRVLSLSGGRKVKEGDTFTETKFAKRFTLGDKLDTENLTANLANGVLEVTVPKKEPDKKESAKVITITQHPSIEDANK
jgi:HSP20 family protein